MNTKIDNALSECPTAFHELTTEISQYEVAKHNDGSPAGLVLERFCQAYPSCQLVVDKYGLYVVCVPNDISTNRFVAKLDVLNRNIDVQLETVS